MLPVHGVDKCVGGLDTRRQPGQSPGCDDDSSFVQHAGENDQHVVDADGVVVLCDITLGINKRHCQF